LSVIKWASTKTDAAGHVSHDGLYYKVVLPMITSPIIGLVGGFLVITLLLLLVHNCRPQWVGRVFGKLQLVSCTYMAWAHGFADGQKTMGIMALACFTATMAGHLNNLPGWLSFLYTPKFEVPFWIKLSCALALAFGTYGGGWRIIHTLGRKLVRINSVQGLAAETTAASLLLVTGKLGMPISTTHSITTAIMGVGLSKGSRALNLVLVERIVWAWILTIPCAGALAFVLVWLAQRLGFAA
jgi:PiT family inorganic phosphate transporter